jgi:hypothetical protein
MWLINKDVVAQQECDCSMRMLSLDRNVVAQRGCGCSTRMLLLNGTVVANEDVVAQKMRMLSLKKYG